jgi:hypothetical protein
LRNSHLLVFYKVLQKQHPIKSKIGSSTQLFRAGEEKKSPKKKVVL